MILKLYVQRILLQSTTGRVFEIYLLFLSFCFEDWNALEDLSLLLRSVELLDLLERGGRVVDSIHRRVVSLLDIQVRLII